MNELSFREKPVQCQIAALESDNFFLGNLFSKGNAAHVNAGQAHENLHQLTRMSELPVNPTPTNKPQSETGGGFGGDGGGANTPSADGCNYDAQGKPNCAVQSQGAEYDPFVGLSAEYGEQIQTQTQQKKYEPLPSNDEIRKRIVTRPDADKNRCRDFLDAVRKQLKIKDRIEQIFDKTIKDGGFGSGPDIDIRKGSET